MNNIRLILVEEKDKKKYERKYKCPYCEKKFTRKTMPPHIQNTHEDLIPEGMTALQITFNTVNNKKEPYGSCIVCKSNTSWNESKDYVVKNLARLSIRIWLQVETRISMVQRLLIQMNDIKKIYRKKLYQEEAFLVITSSEMVE